MPQGEDDTMAKKSAAKKIFKAKKTKTVETPARAWQQTYEFVKPLKVEPVRETILGVAYGVISKAKSPQTIDQIAEKAVSAGLGEYSDQNPRTQMQIMLRRLAAQGSVRILRATAGGDAAPVKPRAKAGEAEPKAKKTAKVVKAAGKAGKGATKATKAGEKAPKRSRVVVKAPAVASADEAAADV